MPDMKTALTTALSQPAKAAKEMIEITKKEFADNVGKPFSTGVVVTVFNYIKDNPGCKSRQVNQALNPKGYPETSVSSVISKLVKRKFVKRDPAGCLNTIKAEYKIGRKRSKSKVKSVSEPTSEVLKSSLIDTISIREAKELYIELKKIFEKV